MNDVCVSYNHTIACTAYCTRAINSRGFYEKNIVLALLLANKKWFKLVFSLQPLVGGNHRTNKWSSLYSKIIFWPLRLLNKNGIKNHF